MEGKGDGGGKGIFTGSAMALVLLVMIGGFFLWTQHQAHVMGALPYLILLLCPLMHFFMHRGHGQPQECDKDQKTGRILRNT